MKLTLIKFWLFKFKYLILSFFLLILYIYFSTSSDTKDKVRIYFSNTLSSVTEDKERSCYSNTYIPEHTELLQDVLSSKVQPTFGKSIFFHETSCRNGIISINAR